MTTAAMIDSDRTGPNTLWSARPTPVVHRNPAAPARIPAKTKAVSFVATRLTPNAAAWVGLSRAAIRNESQYSRPNPITSFAPNTPPTPARAHCPSDICPAQPVRIVADTATTATSDTVDRKNVVDDPSGNGASTIKAAPTRLAMT